MSAPIPMTPYTVALRFLGVKETPGHVHNPMIVAMMQVTDRSIRDDETPWCAGLVNYCAWVLGLKHSRSLAARSWLGVGQPIDLEDARPGFDVVILSRGANPAPANVLSAPGHVGFFHAYKPETDSIELLGGNQGNEVCIASYPRSRLLGVRRLG